MSQVNEALALAEVTFQTGLGTEESPFEIHNEEEFHRIALFPNANFKLAKDLNLIRPVDTIARFDGVFDGGGRTLTALRGSGSWIRLNHGRVCNTQIVDASFRDQPDYPACGVIEVNHGVVKDLRVHASNHCVQELRDSIVAGIIGLNQGLLDRCTFSGEVQSLHGRAGGLVGFNAPDGRIIECTVLGNTIVGTTNGPFVGGACAVSGGAITLTRVSRGVLVNLTSAERADAGGLVGHLRGDGIVTRCSAQADIQFTGKKKVVGAIVGLNSGTVVDVEAGGKMPKWSEGCAVGIFIGGQTVTGTLKGEVVIDYLAQPVPLDAELQAYVEKFKIGVNEGDLRRRVQRPVIALVRNESGGEGTH